jgi:hypothetical protein
MGRKTYVKDGVEHESRIGEFREKYNISVDELARICGCGIDDISKLQNGMMSPFYEFSRKRDGVSYFPGDIRPYVEVMSAVFDASVSELFPRYSCEFDRQDNMTVILKDFLLLIN